MLSCCRYFGDDREGSDCCRCIDGAKDYWKEVEPAAAVPGGQSISLYGLLLQGLLRERVRGAQHLERWLGGPLEGLGSSRCSRRA